MDTEVEILGVKGDANANPKTLVGDVATTTTPKPPIPPKSKNARRTKVSKRKTSGRK